MSTVNVRPIHDDLSFGARVAGVTLDNLRDPDVRDRLNEAFEARGLLIFEEVDPTPRCRWRSALCSDRSRITRARRPLGLGDDMLGVIEIRHDPNEGGVVQLDGRLLSQWLPWHFDHCYNNELNRAGVLRAVEIPPDGGMTGFVDGIALYGAVSPEVRDRIEGEMVIYAMDVILDNLRFGRPEGFVEVQASPGAIDVMTEYEHRPRAIHPAVWTRRSGEKVLHVSPWMAKGIEGRDDADADVLLTEVCDEIVEAAKSLSYFHSWAPTDMVDLGQLADPSLGVGLCARRRPLHAPNDHRRRLRPRPLRGGRPGEVQRSELDDLSHLPYSLLAPGDEAVPLLGILEADDRPGLVHAGASEGLDPVVAVLEHQLVVTVRDDDRRRARGPPRCVAPGRRRRLATRRRRPRAAPASPGGPANRCSWSSGTCTGPSHQRGCSDSDRPDSALSLPGLAQEPATQSPSSSRSRCCPGGFGRVLLGYCSWSAPLPRGAGGTTHGMGHVRSCGGTCRAGGRRFVVGAQQPSIDRTARAPTRSGRCSWGAGGRWWRDRRCRAAGASTP